MVNMKMLKLNLYPNPKGIGLYGLKARRAKLVAALLIEYLLDQYNDKQQLADVRSQMVNI